MAVDQSNLVCRVTPEGDFDYLDYFSDNFDDNSIDTANWNVLGANYTLQEVNQHIEIDLLPGSANGNLVTKNHYDFRFKGAQLKLIQLPVEDGLVTSYMKVCAAATNQFAQIGIYTAPRQILFALYDVSNKGNRSVLYDPDVHKWIRIRENSGTIFFDTSVDGFNWTNQYSIHYPSLDWSSTAEIRIRSQCYNTGITGGQFIFDNFNIAIAGIESSNVASRLTVRKEDTSDLPSRLEVRVVSSSSFVSRITIRQQSSSSLVSQVTIRRESNPGFICRVTVTHFAGDITMVYSSVCTMFDVESAV